MDNRRLLWENVRCFRGLASDSETYSEPGQAGLSHNAVGNASGDGWTGSLMNPYNRVL